MFDTVLIANRGVIACRVIRSLKVLGLRSVAVYSEADADSLHVAMADESVCIGPAPASQSYLNVQRILEVAQATGAGAIHPGYGFLSENPDFAQACEDAGIAFIGPTPAQMRAFGLKHTARALAEAHGVPLLPGSGLLVDVQQALAEAARIGYPVMLKSTAGGGGIGMRLIRNAAEMGPAFAGVQRLASANFKDAGLFLEKFVERARHIEVQIFGDGHGTVVAVGERDCSAQRRNQKVVEETPAPGLSEATRQALQDTAVRLARAVNYRSAGTVEYVLDADTGAFYFLEVNTRLQVEHGVTEQVFGVDLVSWMLRLARGDQFPLTVPTPHGASIQVRLYAEDPARNFQPCAGVLTEVVFPDLAIAGPPQDRLPPRGGGDGTLPRVPRGTPTVRIETWVATGSEVPPNYDPMIAKLIVTGADRADAVAKLQSALAATRLGGIETNLRYLRAVASDPVFVQGRMVTRSLGELHYQPQALEVLEPGVQTTVQDHPGRIGYWAVGVPPSGPMDDLAMGLANRLVGNAPGTAALECTLSGPRLRVHADTVVAVCGAAMDLAVDGLPLPLWQPHTIRAGSVFSLGAVQGAGARSYLAVRGGLDVPLYLGSRSTFTLGQFGGHAGRTVRAGDMLHVGADYAADVLASLPPDVVPAYAAQWDIAVLYGPHGAPDFFTDGDVHMFFATDWEVHYNSSRTGVRLIGPKPEWARRDGGEAGLHPSNIHDNAYAIGAIDFTGDMPVILGPDGPSLGGFVCPAVVLASERWKLGQLRPGNKVRFRCVTAEEAAALHAAHVARVQHLHYTPPALPLRSTALGSPVLAQRAAQGDRPALVLRQAGDRYVLVELGDAVLDIALRMRVHALMHALQGQNLPGIVDLTPGIRSLQIHFDPLALEVPALLAAIFVADDALGDTADIEVPSRTVHLPLSWDDSATRLAIERYMQSVRPDAPWCPSNIEFIRRINGLQSIEQVQRIVFEARYLVMGLGDVYLGAPVATPLDPRHRLVTTKYNPARTWTPENAVGIGGAYMCVYGMEGPGGYQFVGRTLQMWNRWRDASSGAPAFEAGKPWLLRFFDQICFYPVGEEELLQIRRDFPSGRYPLRVEEGTFSLRDYQRFLQTHATDIANFRRVQGQAFEEERERWREAGQAEYLGEPEVLDRVGGTDALPAGARVATTAVPGSVWKLLVAQGAMVSEGEALLIVESMKMEFTVPSPCAGRVLQLLCREGQAVGAGQNVVVIQGENA
ncbi:MAG: urea carboxylase [Rhodoferax sp.]|nr:urea carboxylase [Rhodoferax sp.]